LDSEGKPDPANDTYSNPVLQHRFIPVPRQQQAVDRHFYQAWLEKNQEKFGDKHVKFGYVVYTDREVAARLLRIGYVAVGRAKVGVKPMDGRPAAFAF